MSFTFSDQIHLTPKYEIYVDEDVDFTARVLLWSVPSTHELYSLYGRSVKKVTLCNLIKHIMSLKLVLVYYINFLVVVLNILCKNYYGINIIVTAT